MSKKVIESILKTYEIPGKLKGKIGFIALQRVEEDFINDYNQIYDYIAHLIEKFQTPYEGRFFIRLDSQKYKNSNAPYYEFFSSEETEKIPKRQMDSKNTLSLSDTYKILERYLDKTSFSLFQQLLFKEDVKFNVSEEFLIKNHLKIQEKLEKLVKKNKNRFVIPKRPIIQLQPIKFGRRTYNKNPLAFFNSHPDSYGGLSRTQLSKFDAGLYESLRRWGQIEFAIPKTVIPGSSTKLKQNKIDAIIYSYKNCKIVQRVAKEHNVSRTVVDTYLIKANLKKPRKKTGTYGYPKEKIDEIIKAHDKCKIANQVAKKFNVTRFTVIKHWREAGLEILSKGNSQERIKYYAKK